MDDDELARIRNEEIMTLFERLHTQGHTIILATHEPDIAAHAQRVIHLRDGHVEKDARKAKRVPAQSRDSKAAVDTAQ